MRPSDEHVGHPAGARGDHRHAERGRLDQHVRQAVVEGRDRDASRTPRTTAAARSGPGTAASCARARARPATPPCRAPSSPRAAGGSGRRRPERSSASSRKTPPFLAFSWPNSPSTRRSPRCARHAVAPARGRSARAPSRPVDPVRDPAHVRARGCSAAILLHLVARDGADQRAAAASASSRIGRRRMREDRGVEVVAADQRDQRHAEPGGEAPGRP